MLTIELGVSRYRLLVVCLSFLTLRSTILSIKKVHLESESDVEIISVGENASVPSLNFCSFASFQDGSWKESSRSDGPVASFSNLSCPFENLQHSCFQSLQVEKARRWARTSYVPTDSCDKRGQEMLFRPSSDGLTIIFLGDSMARQTFISFACSIASENSPVELLSYNVRWSPAKSWCNSENWCFQNNRDDNMFNGYNRAEASFRYNGVDLHVRFFDSHMSHAVRLTTAAAQGRKTVILLSDGVRPGSLSTLSRSIAQVCVPHANILCVYQEIPAAHFPTPDGYWRRGWNRHSSHCVDTSGILNHSSEPSLNSKTFEIVDSAGISILPVWNATQAAGPDAHIGLGKDCLHFCNPGVPVMFAEQFTHFLIDVQEQQEANKTS